MSSVMMWLSICVWMLTSWLTHIIVCLKDGSWGFLVAGALLMPIAWIHGTGVWLGLW